VSLPWEEAALREQVGQLQVFGGMYGQLAFQLAMAQDTWWRAE
jgi:hypothetical protein